MSPGWHVNSHKPSEEYLIPTEVRVEPDPVVMAGEPRYPEGKNLKFAFADKPLSVYEDRFTVEVPITFRGAPPPVLNGSVEFQACSDKECLAPASVKFQAKPVAGAAPRTLAGGAVPLSSAPANPTATASSAGGVSARLGELLEKRNYAVVLPILFLAGLLLNATPCVLPVIPLTIAYFLNQAPGNRRRALWLATIYVLGIATMYSALGAAAGLSGKLFGAALQSPWVIGGVSVILVALALSMFGFYDIRPPQFLMQKAGARAGSAGAYIMGLFVGVVAAPCVGPAIVVLLAFVAAKQDAGLGFLLFFVLSLGLGLPYFFLGAFLPKPGEWMEEVKKAFGWILLAMVGYFVRNLIPPPAAGWIVPAILLIGSGALLVRAARGRRRIPLVGGVLLLLVAVFFLPRLGAAPAGPDWRPYSEADIASAGRPSVIDFSATWCAPCRELDEKTFIDRRVHTALSRRALFKADLTRAASPEAVALTQKYQILGVPTVIFLDASGNERKELRLVGFEGPEEFLARVAKAP